MKKTDKRKNNGGHPGAGRKKLNEIDKKTGFTLILDNKIIMELSGKHWRKDILLSEIKESIKDCRLAIYGLIENKLKNN